jgi:hypothetical protein
MSGRVQLALGRADQPTVPVDGPGGVIQGLAGQRQRGRLEEYRSPWAADADLGRSLHLPGLRHAQGDTPYLISSNVILPTDQDENAHSSIMR